MISNFRKQKGKTYEVYIKEEKEIKRFKSVNFLNLKIVRKLAPRIFNKGSCKF